jgi:hypothetical protein
VDPVTFQDPYAVPPPVMPPPRRRRRRTAAWAGSAIAIVIAASVVAGVLATRPAPSTAAPVDDPVAAVTSPSPTPTPTLVATPSPTPAAVAETDGAPTTALAQLDSLAVKGRAPKTGYDRTGQFGSAWLDVDRNGCDTRNDVLARDLTATKLSGPCKVLAGTLADPYTATTISFLRGDTTSTLVQIDHVVALLNAWETGAQQLTPDRRLAFANDPLNLLAVDGPANSSKGAGDAATWLPANTAFRCDYVSRQVAVKAAYGLWVTVAEKDAITRILGTCPGQPVATTIVTPEPTPVPTAAPEIVPEVAPAPAPAVDVYYENCSAVRAAGAAPLTSGQPGYSRKLDRDGDGVACDT